MSVESLLFVPDRKNFIWTGSFDVMWYFFKNVGAWGWRDGSGVKVGPLAEYPHLVPYNPVGCLTPTCNSSSRGIWCHLLASTGIALICTNLHTDVYIDWKHKAKPFKTEMLHFSLLRCCSWHYSSYCRSLVDLKGWLWRRIFLLGSNSPASLLFSG